MAHDTVAFIRALGLDQVDLLGFSMGGLIAQVIAREQPHTDRAVAGVWAGVAGSGSAGWVSFVWVGWLMSMEGDPASRVGLEVARV